MLPAKGVGVGDVVAEPVAGDSFPDSSVSTARSTTLPGAGQSPEQSPSSSRPFRSGAWPPEATRRAHRTSMSVEPYGSTTAGTTAGQPAASSRCCCMPAATSVPSRSLPGTTDATDSMPPTTRMWFAGGKGTGIVEGPPRRHSRANASIGFRSMPPRAGGTSGPSLRGASGNAHEAGPSRFHGEGQALQTRKPQQAQRLTGVYLHRRTTENQNGMSSSAKSSIGGAAGCWAGAWRCGRWP